LWAVIDACLHPDPAARPAPREVAARLRTAAFALKGVPPLAHLASEVMTYRPRVAPHVRTGRRRRIRMLAGAGVLAAVLFTGGAALANSVIDNGANTGRPAWVEANKDPSAKPSTPVEPAPTAPAESAPAQPDEDTTSDDAAPASRNPSRGGSFDGSIGSGMPDVNFPRR
jgi:hypothetical protein